LAFEIRRSKWSL